MGNLPLHPMVVHLPVVLAGLMPVVLLVVLWLRRSGRVGRSGWLVAVAMAVLLSAGAFAAVRTGEAEEDRVEAVVPESAFERHEERGELLQWATLGLLAVVLAAAAVRAEKVERAVGWMALGVSAAVLVLAILVGHSGAQLVYEHGAASAYTGAAGGQPLADYDTRDDD